MVAANLPPDRATRQKMMDDLFARTNLEREMVRKAREEAKAMATRKMMGERFDIDPIAIQMVMRLNYMPPQRRAKVWTQVQILANDIGLDEDVPVEEEEETGPVFDRSRTGQRQGGSNIGPEGARAARGESRSVIRTRVNLKMAEEMMERARKGLPMRHRVGRPSNEERAAQAYAEQRLEEEFDIARQRDSDQRVIEHQASPPAEQQAEGGHQAERQDPPRAIDLED
jgi:hypothetical protein